ncbi:MAG: heavy metal-associated domain-containing protein [Bryobacteraceae bacterium]
MNQPVTLQIDGMHCGACVRRVTAALSQVPGIQVDDVSVGSARIEFTTAEASPQAAADAVTKIGFAARVTEGG